MKCIGSHPPCGNTPTHLAIVLDEEALPTEFVVWPLCPEHMAEQIQNDIADDGVATTIQAVLKIN